MLNYIWLGLILIAVTYAGYRDLTNDPPMIEATSVVFRDFESGTGFDPAEGYAPKAGTPLGTASQYAVDLSTGRAEIPVGETLELEDERWRKPLNLGTPESLQLMVLGDVSIDEVGATFVDKDGEKFEASAGAPKSAETWSKLTVPMADLKASDAKATVDYPLTLESLYVSGTGTGTVRIDNLALHFPKQLFVSSDKLEAKTWMGVITASTVRWAEISIELAIGLIGIMMLWLGIMRIAEAAGLVQAIARTLKPLMVWLFPELPPNGEAMGAIVMNIAANMLGLGNAATPLGLKAMEEMQKVNPHKEYASNAMCMLLSLNTSSVTFITPTIIAYRGATGSTDIMKFWPIMIGATLISTVVAVTACKLLEKLPVFAIPADAETREVNT